MTSERRKKRKLTEDEVKAALSSKQLAALLECQYFGWKLKYIRRPLFQDPVPVLYNAKNDQIGILDPDGHVNTDIELDVRSGEAGTVEVKPQQQAKTAPESRTWEEKRKDILPIPDNLGELLNQQQMQALRHIESFGWQLQFVRRPMFQEPVPVILGPAGDKFAILERDGRINVTHDLNVRKEATGEENESALFTPASEMKLYK